MKKKTPLELPANDSSTIVVISNNQIFKTIVCSVYLGKASGGCSRHHVPQFASHCSLQFQAAIEKLELSRLTLPFQYRQNLIRCSQSPDTTNWWRTDSCRSACSTSTLAEKAQVMCVYLVFSSTSLPDSWVGGLSDWMVGLLGERRKHQNQSKFYT